IQAIHPNWYPTADQKEHDKIDWNHPDKDKVKNLCEQMLQYDVKLCPTLVIMDQIAQLPDYWDPSNKVTKTIKPDSFIGNIWATAAAEHEDELKQQLGNQVQFIKEIARAYAHSGGTIVAGTDTPGGVRTFPGMALHRELELFVEIGFTEMKALQAATNKAADAINMM